MKKNHLIAAMAVAAIAAVAAGAYHLGSRKNTEFPAGQTAKTAIAGDSRSFREILNETDPIRFRAGFLNYLQRMTAGEAEESAYLLWAMPGELREVTENKKLFSYAWGALDGQAAVEFVYREKGVAKVAALSQAFAGWASDDPQEAKRWTESHLEPAERLLHSWALVDGWARHDPDAATDYVLGLGKLPGRDRFMRSIALEQLRRSPQDATAWASKLPAGSLRQSAVDEIARRWARAEPREAIDWARTLGDQDNRDRAVHTTLTEWARFDSVASGEYLNSMPDNAVKDHAIAAYVEVLAIEDLEATSSWANLIRDSALREQSLLRIASDWSTRNPVALAEWLPQSGLSEAAIEGLR